jgi:hypothetical protein
MSSKKRTGGSELLNGPNPKRREFLRERPPRASRRDVKAALEEILIANQTSFSACVYAGFRDCKIFARRLRGKTGRELQPQKRSERS